jgi:hypothetical protein
MGLKHARSIIKIMLKVIKMNERILYGESQEPIAVSPIYRADTTTTLGEIELDYSNARLRRFPGNSDMDHLEYTDPDGNLHGIFFSHLHEEALAELAELGYPASVDPIPSKADIAWYDQAVMSRMNITGIEQNMQETPAPTPEEGKTKDTVARMIVGATALMLVFAADRFLEDRSKAAT